MTREEAIEVYNGLINEKIKEAFEFFAPELRESEDERIRKYIINFVKLNKNVNLSPDDADRMLDWLEKQKEQKPKNILTDDDSLQTAYLKGQTDVLEDPEAYGLQKEQKPTISDEAIREGIVHFGITQYQIDNWLKKHINIVEEKPAEQDSEEVFDKIDNSFRKGREVGFREGVESVNVKPAEWSEEDKRALNDAIVSLSECAYGKIPHILPSMLLETVERLKSIRLQPKQEWSGEDENMVNDIIHNLEDLKKTFSSNGDREYAEETQKQIDWLKSHYAWRTFIDRAIKWLDDTFYFQDYSSGRGEDHEITTNEFDSMDEMFDSFRKTVFLRPVQK